MAGEATSTEATQTQTQAPPETTEPTIDPRLSALIAAGKKKAGSSSSSSPPAMGGLRATAPAPAETSAPPSTETPPPAETPETEETEPSEGDPAIATSWEELNRRDAGIKGREAQIKQRERDLATYDQIMAARGDPLALMQALGYNRTQLLDAVIAQGDGHPAAQQPHVDTRQFIPRQEVEARLAATKAEISYQNRIRHAIAQSEAELVKLAADGENGDKVVEEILTAAAEEFDRTKVYPDLGDLIKRKEGEYERQTFGLLEFLGRSTKVKERLAGQATTSGNTTSPPPGTSTKPQQQKQALPATLSNDMQTEPATHKERPKTVAEKRAAFIDIISASWKKGAGPKAR